MAPLSQPPSSLLLEKIDDGVSSVSRAPRLDDDDSTRKLEKHHRQDRDEEDSHTISAPRIIRERSVSFAQQDLVHEVESFKQSLSRKERRRVFMERPEYECIQRENDTILNMMNQGIFPTTEKRYFRGLEFMMPETREERKVRYLMALTSLRQGQAVGSLNDPLWIQSYYSRITGPAALVAHQIGIWDAEAVLAELVADEDEEYLYDNPDALAYDSSSDEEEAGL